VEDTGAYAILAKNDNGETRGVISLQVYAKGLKGNLDPGTIRRGVMEHVPVVTRRLQDVRCCDGDSVTLEATVDAPKNSLVRWEKQGKVLKLSNDIESEWDGNKVRLRIKEVYPEDEGEYSCIVFNDQGKAVTSATVIVEMADDKENDVTVQMEHRPDMSRRTTPSCSRSITPSRWSRSPSVAFQREGSAHSWAGAGSSWRESSVSISHWRPMSRGASPMLLAHRMTPEPSPKTRARRSHGPKFYYIPHDRIVEEGESVTFQCAVKGNPTPRATWDKDAMKISTGGRVNIESKDDIRLIEIPKVTQQDAGLYRITIENDLGREQATARLDVIKSTGNKYTGYVRSWHTSPSTTPYFSRTLPSSSVLTGSRMQLSTDFRGSPAPRAKWYKNGELLPMCDEYQQTQNGKSASLEISEVESTDAGTYTCTIVSDAGKAECSCEVTVETRKDTGDLPPLFLRGLEDITSLDGDQVTLSIKLSGTRPLKVIWVRNDQEIKPSTDFRYVEGEDGEFSLVIRDVFPEDAGVYIAEAYNVHGEAHSYCRLQVHDPRLSAASQPRIVGSLTGLEVEEGTAARFNVTVLGSPRPSLAWYIDGRKLANTPRIKVSVDEESGTSEETLHSLGILHALSTDSGVVSVVATNSLGSDTANTILKVNKYSPPSENKAQSHSNSLGNTNSSGGKSLTPGKTSPAISTSPAPRIQPTLKDFKEMGGVSSVDSGVGSVTRDSASGMSSSLSNVSELEYDKDLAGQSEKITIHSITETAKKQEQQLSITKQQQQPPEEEEEEEEEGAEILLGPVDVTATTGQSAKFTANFIGNPEPTVSWLKKDHEIEANSRFKILTEKGSSTLSIENVTPDDCDKYTIVVRNKHAAHASFASLTVASVPDPPVEKPNLSEVTAESVTLSWYGPTYDGGSCVTGYIVESRKIGQVPWNTLITGVHSTSYIARGLESGSQYEFRTRAQNVHGKSEPSKPSQPVTIENKSKEDTEKEIKEEDEEYKYPPFEVTEVALEPGALYDSSYETFEEVGKGRFGVVFRCVNKETGQKRAAKIIKCIRGTEKEKVREEISIMNSLRHPKLLQLGAAYEKQREIVMVMEYITGGELFERVIAEDFALTERDCILFVRQICEGVQYMHDNMILHLDLKPENILCVHKRSHQIKLIDFGLARRFNPDDPCRVLFGTPEFIAPEIINYDPISFVSDMWSIGVVCYVLLSGLSPFMGDNDAETFANITQAEFDFDDDAFDNISEDAKSFITSLLDKRKEKRLLAKDCLKHKWLAQNEGSMNKVVISTDKLKKFIIRRKWQDVAFSKVERHNSPVPL